MNKYKLNDRKASNFCTVKPRLYAEGFARCYSEE